MSNEMSKTKRDQWITRTGFILATAGSAVGLGNLWKFPAVAGANGGGAFVFVYLIIVLLLGCTVMISEITLGRHTQLNAWGAYKKIKAKWAWVGAMGILAAFLIMGFYCVAGGWVIKYLVMSITGALNINDPNVLGGMFDGFVASSFEPIVYTIIFIVLTHLIVFGGISKGIEKASKIMMPGLFVFIVIIAIRSVTLDGAMEGLKWFLVPDFSKIDGKVILMAMGQVFFSLSLGMGCMTTYGSYLKKDSNIAQSGLIIPLLDTLAAFLAGIAILPAVFAFGFEPSGGPGLMFVTLPAIFSRMPFGNVFAILFFLLVLFAALTSSISLLEVIVAYLVDEKKKSRKFATTLGSIIIFIMAIPASLSFGPLSQFHLLPNRGFFDTYDFVADNIILPLGGLLLCIFVGWVWGTDNAIKEISNDGELKFKLAPIWSFLVKFVAPIAIIIIFIQSIGIFG